MSEVFDVLTVGLGPASYSCALYTTRYKLSTKMIGAQDGGQVFVSGEIGNYLGTTLTTGFELAQSMRAQADANGAVIAADTVTSIARGDDGIFTVTGSIGGAQQARTVLLATGLKHRKLGVPGETEMYGKGVTYCATCDGMFFRGKPVAVVGAGNSAAEAALYLSELCPEVRVFVRKPAGGMRADAILIEKLEAKDNVIIEYETQIAEITGEQRVEGVTLTSGETRKLEGIFVEIGADASSGLARDAGVALDAEGFVVVDDHQQTNIPGLFCAGDLSTASNKFAQIIVAAGEGAIAADGIKQYLNQLA